MTDVSRQDEAWATLSRVEPFASMPEQVVRDIIAATREQTIPADHLLIREGDPGDAMYFVLEGRLRVVGLGPDGEQTELAIMLPGMPIGEIQLAIGGARTSTVISIEPCRLLRLGKAEFDRLAVAHRELMPLVAATVRRRLRRSQLGGLLARLLGHVDAETVAAIESVVTWVHLDAGEPLFRQGDPGDAWYIIESGRVRVDVEDASGGHKTVGEMGAGESVGESALLDDAARAGSVYALRATDLVRISRDDFQTVAWRFPGLLLWISRHLIRRLRDRNAPATGRSGIHLAVIPSATGAPTRLVADNLVRQLQVFGPVLHVTSATLREHGLIDDHALDLADQPAWLRVDGWIEREARRHTYVVLEADPAMTPWTAQVAGLADQLLIVTEGHAPIAQGDVEAVVLKPTPGRVIWPRRTLVIVHDDDVKLPTGTRQRLEARTVDRHVHVRRSRTADFGRLARLLVGRAVGVALGGGGARGYAHLGVVRALMERGVPIDAICGTSMGSIMGASLAMEQPIDEIVALNRELIKTKPFSEYTVPMMALLRTTGIERCAKISFGDVEIEDLWIDFFCVATNLTTGEMVTIDRGPAWRATRASGALPGIVLPVLVDGHLLVDGGVMNNLPGDLMRARHGCAVIAVNVSPETEVRLPLSEMPSQWDIFWRRITPFRETLPTPTIMDILMRTTMLASSAQTQTMASTADYYLRPNVDKFGLLEFESIDGIVERGYEQTLLALADWDLTDVQTRGLPHREPNA